MTCLLERSNIRNEKLKNCVGDMLSECTLCLVTVLPQPSRKVSIPSLPKWFSGTLHVDCSFLDYICIAHCIDVATQFSSGQFVSSTGLYKTMLSFQYCWMSNFRTPVNILSDESFGKGLFSKLIKDLHKHVRPIPPQRYPAFLFKKHDVIRSIF